MAVQQVGEYDYLFRQLACVSKNCCMDLFGTGVLLHTDNLMDLMEQ